MKNSWQKTLELFEPEWYQDLEIMRAFINRVTKEEREEMAKALRIPWRRYSDMVLDTFYQELRKRFNEALDNYLKKHDN